MTDRWCHWQNLIWKVFCGSFRAIWRKLTEKLFSNAWYMFRYFIGHIYDDQGRVNQNKSSCICTIQVLSLNKHNRDLQRNLQMLMLFPGHPLCVNLCLMCYLCCSLYCLLLLKERKQNNQRHTIRFSKFNPSTHWVYF